MLPMMRITDENPQMSLMPQMMVLLRSKISMPLMTKIQLHRELTLHIRKAQQENILRHHELHLERLQMHEGNQYPEELLDERDAELKRKLADEVAGMRQGDLLEQFAFAAELRDDTTGEHCYKRMIKGTGYESVARYARSAARGRDDIPEFRNAVIGFRVAAIVE